MAKQLYWFLLDVDLRSFVPSSHIPGSAHRDERIEAYELEQMDPVAIYLEDIIRETVQHTPSYATDIFTAFQEWCTQRNIDHRLNAISFAIALKKHPSLIRVVDKYRNKTRYQLALQNEEEAESASESGVTVAAEECAGGAESAAESAAEPRALDLALSFCRRDSVAHKTKKHRIEAPLESTGMAESAEAPSESMGTAESVEAPSESMDTDDGNEAPLEFPLFNCLKGCGRLTAAALCDECYQQQYYAS